MSLNGISKAWGYYNLAKVVKQRSGRDIPDPIGNFGRPYRPPQWNGLPRELSQLVLVKTNIGGLFFDAVLRTEHTSTLKITSHPVQNGANITDHSILEPSVLVMEIGMSDTMDSVLHGQYSGKGSKSVSAYQMLLDLQASRIPVSVLTRLKKYDHMLIENITAPDDVKTLHGLRCTVTLREIFVVEVARQKVSARPHDTDQTNRGNLQAKIVDDETAARMGLKIIGIED